MLYIFFLRLFWALGFELVPKKKQTFTHIIWLYLRVFILFSGKSFAFSTKSWKNKIVSYRSFRTDFYWSWTIFG